MGQNLQIEVRNAGGRVERLTVDIIVAAGTQAVEAARRATTTIPIVFPVTFDPAEAGYVASPGRPGGNLTGLTPLNPTVTAKRVELLREVIPRISRVAVLRNPTNPGSAFPLRETQAAAKRLGVRIQVLMPAPSTTSVLSDASCPTERTSTSCSGAPPPTWTRFSGREPGDAPGGHQPEDPPRPSASGFRRLCSRGRIG